jgi:hypothetical protein
MEANLDSIVVKHGAEMVSTATRTLAADAREMIATGLQLVSPESEGSPVEGVEPYQTFTHPKFGEVTRADIKKKLGQSRPDLPRYGTGALLQSIHAEFGGLEGAAGTDLPYALDQQEGGSEWTDEFGARGKPAAPRPFLGISRQSLDQIEVNVGKIFERMVGELDRQTLPTQTVTA